MDWKKKRIAQAWECMIKKEWHTDTTARTHTEGVTGGLGFIGEYEITVTHGVKNKIFYLTLKNEQETLHI
jgi:hypothetical protein